MCGAILNRVIMVGFTETIRFEQRLRSEESREENHRQREHKIILGCENYKWSEGNKGGGEGDPLEQCTYMKCSQRSQKLRPKDKGPSHD